MDLQQLCDAIMTRCKSLRNVYTRESYGSSDWLQPSTSNVYLIKWPVSIHISSFFGEPACVKCDTSTAAFCLEWRHCKGEKTNKPNNHPGSVGHYINHYLKITRFGFLLQDLIFCSCLSCHTQLHKLRIWSHSLLIFGGKQKPRIFLYVPAVLVCVLCNEGDPVARHLWKHK